MNEKFTFANTQIAPFQSVNINTQGRPTFFYKSIYEITLVSAQMNSEFEIIDGNFYACFPTAGNITRSSYFNFFFTDSSNIIVPCSSLLYSTFNGETPNPNIWRVFPSKLFGNKIVDWSKTFLRLKSTDGFSNYLLVQLLITYGNE